MPSRVTAVAVLLLLAACSTEPAPGVAETTQPDADMTTTVAPTTSAPVETTTTTADITTTIGESTVSSALVVASEAGIQLVDGTETITLLDVPASVAADDLMGGVVFQGVGSAQGFFDEPEESIVWWLPEGAENPQSLLVPTGDQVLRLIDVELIDGSPRVVYIRMDDRGDFNNAIDTLRVYDFESGEVSEVRTVGGWESGTSHVTFGAGVFASNWFGEAYSGFDFFDVNGDDVAVVGDPYGDAICFDGTLEPGTEDSGVLSAEGCSYNVAISPDGTRLAYTVVVRDAEMIVRAIELVVVDTGDGSELHRLPIRTREPFSIDSLEILGDTVLYNQSAFVTSREQLPATVVELTTGQIATLPLPGAARFASTLSGG